MGLDIKIVEKTINAPTLFPDTVWDGFIGDWAPAAPTEPSNRGGLRARAPLETAILLCLASDARAELSNGEQTPDGSNDPRGWAGDALDADIDPLGSKLWLLRRHALNDDTGALAVVYAQSALFTLIKQGVVAKFDVTAEVVLEIGRLELFVNAFRDDGTLSAETQFALLWEKNRAVHRPLDR